MSLSITYVFPGPHCCSTPPPTLKFNLLVSPGVNFPLYSSLNYRQTLDPYGYRPPFVGSVSFFGHVSGLLCRTGLNSLSFLSHDLTSFLPLFSLYSDFSSSPLPVTG